MSKFPAALAAVAAVALLAGCAPTVALIPAEDATNPACAMVIVSLRDVDTIGDQEQRETNAQSTAAWGNPTSVILHCGVPVPSPTSALPCITVDGIDWLRDDSDAPSYVFTTYGRDPAVSVVIDNDKVAGNVAINAVSAAVSTLPVVSECTTLEGQTEDAPAEDSQ